MTSAPSIPELARTAIKQISPEVEVPFVSIVQFLAAHPEAASTARPRRGVEAFGKEHLLRLAQKFAESRLPRAPQPPATIPDEMVSLILEHYFQIPAADLGDASRLHSLAMGAENLVGDLLERYLATLMEPLGWAWCSGSLVKAVDFVKPGIPPGSWRLLQVKNRDNSENSSSSAIRGGTTIEKWHRTFSRRAGANWSAFPEDSLKGSLSEADFKRFVTGYLEGLRKQACA